MSQNSVLGLITVILLLTSVNGSGFFTLIGEDISTRTNSFIQIVKAKSKCIYGECCIDHFIPGDFAGNQFLYNSFNLIRSTQSLPRAGLQANLTAELFGQHIIVNELASVSAQLNCKHIKSNHLYRSYFQVLQAHYSDNMSKKPLVLSFQGPSGTGKTFVTDLIADYMYTRGTSSRFLHRLTGRLDFPLDSKVEEYKAKLSELITASIADCPRSLFIFDEVEKMPEGIFENIPSLLDYHRQLKGMQTSEAIYIFLSNAHGEEIISELLDLSEGGKLRESTVVSDFKEVLELVVYNQGKYG